ncbi:hypothetical protein V6N00_13400 [Tersicoccus sp. MR15.9]|uniref:hypothetical protein n=1 Tax=Tersicoccus mangrovi TaxID=3121635 RepID=UPI002FE578CE
MDTTTSTTTTQDVLDQVRDEVNASLGRLQDAVTASITALQDAQNANTDLQAQLDTALGRITELESAEATIADLRATVTELEQGRVADQARNAELADTNTELETQLAALTAERDAARVAAEQSVRDDASDLKERLEQMSAQLSTAVEQTRAAARTEARVDSARILDAIAVDHPDLPLARAVDLAQTALGVSADQLPTGQQSADQQGGTGEVQNPFADLDDLPGIDAFLEPDAGPLEEQPAVPFTHPQDSDPFDPVILDMSGLTFDDGSKVDGNDDPQVEDPFAPTMTTPAAA